MPPGTPARATQLQGVLSDVCSALRACADILPDLITWGPAQVIHLSDVCSALRACAPARTSCRT